MDYTAQDYLKKTLLETQERVRDFMHYSEKMDKDNLKEFFHKYAESEAFQAKTLQDLINQEN